MLYYLILSVIPLTNQIKVIYLFTSVILYIYYCLQDIKLYTDLFNSWSNHTYACFHTLQLWEWLICHFHSTVTTNSNPKKSYLYIEDVLKFILMTILQIYIHILNFKYTNGLIVNLYKSKSFRITLHLS